MFMQCNIEMDGQRDNLYVCDRCLYDRMRSWYFFESSESSES